MKKGTKEIDIQRKIVKVIEKCLNCKRERERERETPRKLKLKV